MGDRSNIVIINSLDGEESRVWLYGHWMGEGSIQHAKVGLESGRVGDEGYLARVIFSSMVADDLEGETGFGISTHMLDNEYPIIVISPDHLGGPLVWLEGDDHDVLTKRVTPEEFTRKALPGMDFDQLIAALNS